MTSSLLPAVLVLLLPSAWPDELPPGPPDGVTVWAGRQVVRGSRKVPVLGAVETRTETRVLARVRSTPNGLEVEEQPCSIRFAKVAGVGVKVDDSVVRRLPPARIEWGRRRDGRFQAGPWISGWGKEDVDRDGEPGVTIAVAAPLCSGDLRVASKSTSWGRLREQTPERIEGRVRVQVEQKILGTSGVCLGMVARDSVDRLEGVFRYVPVASDATCDSVGPDGWPDLPSLEPIAGDAGRAEPTKGGSR